MELPRVDVGDAANLRCSFHTRDDLFVGCDPAEEVELSPVGFEKSPIRLCSGKPLTSICIGAYDKLLAVDSTFLGRFWQVVSNMRC